MTVVFFFFQAEDGIRDDLVTGVQTCALPIFAGSTTVPSLNLTYDYGSADNGQIQGITDGITPQQSVGYSYDEVGRLKTAQTTDLVSSGTWKLGFKYDRYGNRLAQLPQGGAAAMPISA